MKAYVLVTLALAACDPIWQVRARVVDPGSRPVAAAWLVTMCAMERLHGVGADPSETAADGTGTVANMGSVNPPPCDLLVLKPGFVTQRIRFQQICPTGREGCETPKLEVVLQPE
jgi:hypothetical protein